MPSALATDLYQITMMAGYYAARQTEPRTFELFVRELPPHRSYLIAAGMAQALDYLGAVHFEPDEIAWLRSVPALAGVPATFFEEHLPRFRFTGEVSAVAEGEVLFGHEPLLRVTAPAPEAQLVETALLAMVTFQTAVASKAARVVQAAAGRSVVEFGSRRAHGLEAATYAARAAYIAGCDATSNVEAGRRFGIPLAGTMAHSWVMAFDQEIDAFREFIRLYGNQSTLLIDTYDTVAAAQQIVHAGLTPAAVRLDSGDLCALARRVRAIFDAGGLQHTRILASGDLDEYRVAALVAAGAPIDAFGVGTAISAVSDAPALGGVYKLVETVDHGAVHATVKLSTGKSTYPGRKQVWRVVERGQASHDVMGLEGEAEGDGRALLKCVMRNGQMLSPPESLDEIRARCRARVAELPAALRDLSHVEPYPVRISSALDDLARAAVRQHGH
jgi:nicotinate phosphoribosyltransferase